MVALVLMAVLASISMLTALLAELYKTTLGVGRSKRFEYSACYDSYFESNHCSITRDFPFAERLYSVSN